MNDNREILNKLQHEAPAAWRETLRTAPAFCLQLGDTVRELDEDIQQLVKLRGYLDGYRWSINADKHADAVRSCNDLLTKIRRQLNYWP